MKNIIVAFFLCTVFAGSPNAAPRFAHSIIIKFKTEASMASPSKALVSALAVITPQDIGSAIHIFIKRTNGNILSVNKDKDEQGLSRIILLPLLDNVDAELASAQLATFAEIEYAEPNYIYHIDAAPSPNDSLYSEQWAHRVMHVKEAWQITKGDTSIHIGFVDTGVEWDHPDLLGQFAVNTAEDINHNGLFDAWPVSEQHLDGFGKLLSGDLDKIDEDGNGYVDDVIGYDFTDQSALNFGDTKDRDAVPQDEDFLNYHGTAVAGVIAAKANNNMGVAGIAPKCKLVVLRAFDGTGNAEDDDIASAIVYAADNNVRIVNLSFGDIIPSLLQRDAIRYAVSKGVLVFASSGNEGTTVPHYPSDFDECVSVGMTVLATNNTSESEDSKSNHGSGLDILAPGVQIITTRGEGQYKSIGGTSFSSPEAAAVAGLVLSHRPDLTNIEVRSILASTSTDMNPTGLGIFDANGRVDALAAVKYRGSAVIKITSPHTNDGFRSGDTINIKGFAVSTLFTDYKLGYIKYISSDLYSKTPFSIISQHDGQVINNSLGVWDTHGLSAGTYTLALFVNSNDHHTTAEYINVQLYDALPKIDTVSATQMYVDEKRGLLIQAHTDTLTTATLYFRAQGSPNWLTKKDDRFTKGHNILLTSKDAPVMKQLEMLFVAKNSAGDSAAVSLTGIISSESVTERGFIQKNYSLPLGFALDTVFAASKGNEVVMSTFSDGSNFGPLKIFSFNNASNQFRVTDSLNSVWIPRTIGNTTGDNKPELLVQIGNSYKIYKQNAAHSLLGDVINESTSMFNPLAFGLADVNNDGKQELLAQDTEKTNIIRSVLKAFKISGASTSLLGKLIDTTPPAEFYSTNNFSQPDAYYADINSDGKLDILTVDGDADILGYEYDPKSPNSFKAIYQDINDGATEGRLLTIGDFNADGKTDITLAYHTTHTDVHDENIDNEYNPSYWTVKVMLGNGDATFQTIYTDHFYLARSLSPYRASTGAIRNVTGSSGDNLVLSLFPNFYLLEYDASVNTMKPIWHYPVSNSPRGALAFDFDKNGKREFGFNAGDSLHFFEQDGNFANRTPSPSGLEIIPRDTNRVDLSWGNVTGATLYYILRADNVTGAFYQLIDSTVNLYFSDTTVTNGSEYIYSVQAFDPSKLISTSEAAFGAVAFVHPKPKMISVSSNDQSIHIRTSQPLSTAVSDGGVLIIDDSILCTSNIIASDSEMIGTASQHLQGAIDHTLRVNSFALRDRWNSPFDTTALITWRPTIIIGEKDFYIVRWRFEGNTRIHLEFNLHPDDNGLDISHYTLTPFGKFVRAYRDPSDPNALYLDLAPGTVISPLGTPFVLCVKGITAESVIILKETEGNCAGETLTEPDLENVMVYPNPAKATDEELTFARLTSEAEISIYTLNMRFLKRLKTTENNGGVKWDMRDDGGKALPSGIYWYHVTGKDESGKEVSPKEAKFVIIRNK